VSSVDLHPEDLLDRARRGAASPDELARLRAHLADCPACRFEHVLASDCARAAVPAPDAPASEAEVLARVRREASRRVRARIATGKHAARGRGRPPRLVFAAAAVLMFAATFAAATTVVRRVWRGPEIEAIGPAPVASRPSHRRVASRPQAAEEPSEAAEPGDALDEGLARAVEEAPAPAPAAHPARARLAAPTETPGELFARANAARRNGHTREAARLYRELQREYPGTSEELVSRVTLGRWMLDRLNDPAGALVRFDSYLANPVHTALREEALIGRALALGRLGREREERSAWTAFLAAFPGSVYAERARGRLEALR
jgi:hypothetical protein